MFTIIVGAIVSLLIFFFQRWWTAHHPIAPTPEAKAAFLHEVNRPRHFWMGHKRALYAEKLFDKFESNYHAIKVRLDSNGPLSEDGAGVLAAECAKGLTLEPHEVGE